LQLINLSFTNYIKSEWRIFLTCKCGSSLPCHCENIIDGSIPATNPEQLMRSRYVAFKSGNVDYLINTSSSNLLNTIDRQDLVSYCQSVKFVNLRVLATNKDMVEFKAQLIDSDYLVTLHERSVFITEDGKWKYDHGELFDIPPKKLSRNDPCPCNSGKKYKKCHA
jgi:SEC-C motif domain protein